MVKKHTKRCRTRGCHGIVTNRACHSPYCPKCRQRRWKAKYPLHYSFSALRRRAKQRGHEFLLTRDEYIAFAIKTDYARLKGKTSLSLSIDRKDDKGPYAAWNIQAITLRENSRKQFVPYFAKQQENINHEPTAEELAAVQEAITK